jgi:hypothetical protein
MHPRGPLGNKCRLPDSLIVVRFHRVTIVLAQILAIPVDPLQNLSAAGSRETDVLACEER